jgi:hypothetical protein
MRDRHSPRPDGGTGASDDASVDAIGYAVQYTAALREKARVAMAMSDEQVSRLVAEQVIHTRTHLLQQAYGRRFRGYVKNAEIVRLLLGLMLYTVSGDAAEDAPLPPEVVKAFGAFMPVLENMACVVALGERFKTHLRKRGEQGTGAESALDHTPGVPTWEHEIDRIIEEHDL